MSFNINEHVKLVLNIDIRNKQYKGFLTLMPLSVFDVHFFGSIPVA